jgi:hypothetical protein
VSCWLKRRQRPLFATQCAKFGLKFIFLTPRVAVVVHTAVEAAAAMQKCTQEWTDHPNVITVDPATASVSYEQEQGCIVFSINSEHSFQFVRVSGLPSAFLDVQQVHPRARETQLKISSNSRRLSRPSASQPPLTLPPCLSLKSPHSSRRQSVAFVTSRLSC